MRPFHISRESKEPSRRGEASVVTSATSRRRMSIVGRARAEMPDLHLHAFSALETAAAAKYENLDT